MTARLISGKARLAGVIGWPIGHSLSPALHGTWLEVHRIDGCYVPLPVSPDDLPAVLSALPRMGFVGANVTVPHKEAVVTLVDRVSETARRLGAINTLVFRDDGSSFGTNTDGYGFLESLRSAVPDWQASGGPVVLLGAGGAARAVCFTLLDAGVPEIRLCNRNLDRAERLAAAAGAAVKPLPWTDRHQALAGATLLVNSTTLGMVGQPSLELSLDDLPFEALVFDLVYRPLMTPLLLAARQRGNRIVDGLGMLLHQGRPGFEAWFHVKPTVTPALRERILTLLGEPCESSA